MAQLLQACILGIVQGITEFLPVSSTAHLILFEHIFKLDQTVYGLTFDMFTNIGTTVALILYYHKDLWAIFSKLRLPSNSKPYSEAEKLPWWILGVTVLVGILGVLLEEQISTKLRSLPVIAGSLIIVGVVMLVAERMALQQGGQAKLTSAKAYLIGLAQAIAFIPGVSRSGITISTGLFAGLNRQAAAKYSFLLSVPITTAAILKKVGSFAAHSASQGISGDILLFYTVGAVVAGIVGYYSLSFFISYLSRASLAVFSYYRFILGIGIILYLVLS